MSSSRGSRPNFVVEETLGLTQRYASITALIEAGR